VGVLSSTLTNFFTTRGREKKERTLKKGIGGKKKKKRKQSPHVSLFSPYLFVEPDEIKGRLRKKGRERRGKKRKKEKNYFHSPLHSPTLNEGGEKEKRKGRIKKKKGGRKKKRGKRGRGRSFLPV